MLCAVILQNLWDGLQDDVIKAWASLLFMKCCIIFDRLIFDYFLQLMSVELAWKSAPKSNKKSDDQKKAALMLISIFGQLGSVMVDFNWCRFWALYVLCGGIWHQVFTFIQIGSGHTVTYISALERNK